MLQKEKSLFTRERSQLTFSAFSRNVYLFPKMNRNVLRDSHWERIEHLLPGKNTDCGVTAKNNRQFVEVVLWITRTRSPRRNLPPEFGHWHRVYVRYNRWSHKGIWKAVFEALSDQPDLEYLMVDGSIWCLKKTIVIRKPRGNHAAA
ncbi:transposase [Oceanobacter sp. 3_MG-2023]|uniref:transposase n=1 Tax=Oceanobacter sp. 3_MG-2023 TaxID=3062622 RepID=UPI002734551D|nr:transposase [Oceanobacter sp. 3_MG-2023]